MTKFYYFHSNSSAKNGGAGWGLYEKGWGGTEEVIQEAFDLGIKHIINRGPEGDPDGAWPLDFYISSRKSPFLKADQIRSHIYYVLEEIGISEYIPYFGSLTHCPKMRDASPTTWRYLYQETTRPWNRCPTWAFDHVGAHGKVGTPAYYQLRLEQALGRTVYGEPHGEGIDEDLLTEGNELDGCIVMDEHWRRAWKKAAFRKNWRGNVIRIARTASEVSAIVDEGEHDVAMVVNVMRDYMKNKKREI